MGYRNKTYVVFDADNDMWAYGFMLGWKVQDHIDFDFHNAHDLKPLTAAANEDTVKRRLRERFSNAKQVVVLVGKNTKNLYRFVRWELEVALKLGLPVIVANLNDLRRMDADLCPPILRGQAAVHVAFRMKIIQKAMDEFAGNYVQLYAGKGSDFRYDDHVYASLGL